MLIFNSALLCSCSHTPQDIIFFLGILIVVSQSASGSAVAAQRTSIKSFLHPCSSAALYCQSRLFFSLDGLMS